MPSLHLVPAPQATVGDVEALPSVLKCDAVVLGVIPRLGGEIVVALPNLHADAVAGVWQCCVKREENSDEVMACEFREGEDVLDPASRHQLDSAKRTLVEPCLRSQR